MNHVRIGKFMENFNWSGWEEFRSQRREIWRNENGRSLRQVKAFGNVAVSCNYEKCFLLKWN